MTTTIYSNDLATNLDCVWLVHIFQTWIWVKEIDDALENAIGLEALNKNECKKKKVILTGKLNFSPNQNTSLDEIVAAADDDADV